MDLRRGVCTVGGAGRSERVRACAAVLGSAGRRDTNGWPRAGGGNEAVEDRSRRPRHSPRRTPAAMERAVLEVRSRHPSWGGRKIAAPPAVDLGETDVPAPSTVTGDPAASWRRPWARPAGRRSVPMLRVVRGPNELWQMDFKGHFALAEGRCHPLTVARRLLALTTCAWRPAATNKARRCKNTCAPPSAATACRSGSSPTTARPGATAPERRTPPSASGCCASASASATAAPIIPRPSARTNASIAP